MVPVADTPVTRLLVEPLDSYASQWPLMVSTNLYSVPEFGDGKGVMTVFHEIAPSDEIFARNPSDRTIAPPSRAAPIAHTRASIRVQFGVDSIVNPSKRERICCSV